MMWAGRESRAALKTSGDPHWGGIGRSLLPLSWLPYGIGGTTTNGCNCHQHSHFGSDKWRCYNQPLFTIRDRKSTRLNSSHSSISYAVFCLKKKNITLI